VPLYDSHHLEYGITNGHIQVVMENGQQLPAYWAHPNTGRLFPAVALIHDWWGITPSIRRIAHQFAQAGYYVIVPDLFDGKVAATPEQAIELVKALGDGGYPRVDAALSVLERHHHTNRDVAAVGVGMGGSLAYEAAIVRSDIEAAVAYYGFPQRYFGRFKDAHAPILAFYGENEPHITASVITRLRQELAANTAGLSHEVVTLKGVAHDFLGDQASPAEHEQGRQAIAKTFLFLEQYLKGPERNPPKTI